MRNKSAALVFSLPAFYGLYLIFCNYVYDLPRFISGENAFQVCYDSISIKRFSNYKKGIIYAYGYLADKGDYIAVDIGRLATSQGESDLKKLEARILSSGVCQKTYLFHTGSAITFREESEAEIRHLLNRRALVFLLSFFPIVAYGILVVIYETIIKTIKRIQGVDDSDSEP